MSFLYMEVIFLKIVGLEMCYSTHSLAMMLLSWGVAIFRRLDFLKWLVMFLI